MWRLLSIFASANHYVLAAKRWRIKSDFVRYKCRHTSFSQYRSLLLLSYGPGATVSHVMLWRGTASGNQTHPPCTRPQSVGKGSDIWATWPWGAQGESCGDTWSCGDASQVSCWMLSVWDWGCSHAVPNALSVKVEMLLSKPILFSYFSIVIGIWNCLDKVLLNFWVAPRGI